MRYRAAASAVTAIVCLFGVTAASATATGLNSGVQQTGSTPAAVTTQSTPNSADAEFVRMMIPHHHQAVIMSQLVPDRSQDDDVRAMASRIDVEQSVEIGAMQGWQGRHGFDVTDPEDAYEDLLEDPDMLEQMGMATPTELDALSAASGEAFDVLFLQLMIEHHEGGIDMAIDVITNGSDQILQQMATGTVNTQCAVPVVRDVRATGDDSDRRESGLRCFAVQLRTSYG